MFTGYLLDNNLCGSRMDLKDVKDKVIPLLACSCNIQHQKPSSDLHMSLFLQV